MCDVSMRARLHRGGTENISMRARLRDGGTENIQS